MDYQHEISHHATNALRLGLARSGKKFTADEIRLAVALTKEDWPKYNKFYFETLENWSLMRQIFGSEYDIKQLRMNIGKSMARSILSHLGITAPNLER